MTRIRVVLVVPRRTFGVEISQPAGALAFGGVGGGDWNRRHLLREVLLMDRTEKSMPASRIPCVSYH